MIITVSGHKWEISLADDGTMDTVISAQRIGSPSPRNWPESDKVPYPVHEFRFGAEYASIYRRTKTGEMTVKGVKELAREGIQGLEIEDLE